MLISIALLIVSIGLTVWLMLAKPYGWVQDVLVLALTAVLLMALMVAFNYALMRS